MDRKNGDLDLAFGTCGTPKSFYFRIPPYAGDLQAPGPPPDNHLAASCAQTCMLVTTRHAFDGRDWKPRFGVGRVGLVVSLAREWSLLGAFFALGFSKREVGYGVEVSFLCFFGKKGSFG